VSTIVPSIAQQMGYATSSGEQLVLASWWRRVGGFLLDDLILAVPGVVLQAIVGSALYSSPVAFGLYVGHPTASSAVRIVLNVVIVVINLAYPVWLLGHKGQTIGMRAVSIRAVDRKSGEALTRTQVRKRVAAFFFLVTVWYEIGFFFDLGHVVHHTSPVSAVMMLSGGTFSLITYLWPLGNPLNQTLQDKYADTVVVLTK
jgi:uncharacterized RDD family membrane protein YckC